MTRPEGQDPTGNPPSLTVDELRELSRKKVARLGIKVGLSIRHWTELWEGGYARGKFQAEGVHESPWGRPLYGWDIQLKGTKRRACIECRSDMVNGECGVFPFIPDEEAGHGFKPSPYLWHTRCVTPEQWRQWLDSPRSWRAARSMMREIVSAPDITEKSLLECSNLELAIGVDPTQAVNMLKTERERQRRALGLV